MKTGVRLSGEGVEPVVWERWLSRRAADAAELNIQLARSILQRVKIKRFVVENLGESDTESQTRWTTGPEMKKKCERRSILVERSEIQSLYSSWTPRERSEILDAISFANSTFLNFLHSTPPPNTTHSCYLEVVILTQFCQMLKQRLLFLLCIKWQSLYRIPTQACPPGANTTDIPDLTHSPGIQWLQIPMIY